MNVIAKKNLTLYIVVYRSSETSTNQMDVIIRSDDRFLNLVVDSGLTLFFGWFFFLSPYWQKYCSFIPAVFFALILTNIWQFCPSLLLTLSQYTYLDYYLSTSRNSPFYISCYTYGKRSFVLFYFKVNVY